MPKFSDRVRGMPRKFRYSSLSSAQHVTRLEKAKEVNTRRCPAHDPTTEPHGGRTQERRRGQFQEGAEALRIQQRAVFSLLLGQGGALPVRKAR